LTSPFKTKTEVSLATPKKVNVPPKVIFSELSLSATVIKLEDNLVVLIVPRPTVRILVFSSRLIETPSAPTTSRLSLKCN